jgi:hypothetical protein
MMLAAVVELLGIASLDDAVAAAAAAAAAAVRVVSSSGVDECRRREAALHIRWMEARSLVRWILQEDCVDSHSCVSPLIV